jgi:hypothetical protein
MILTATSKTIAPTMMISISQNRTKSGSGVTIVHINVTRLSAMTRTQI